MIRTMTITDARQAVSQVFALIDGEQWDRLSQRLADDVQLSDELTGVWLRGRDRVTRYLRAQSGVVTELTSVTEDVDARSLASGLFLVTFNLRQRYLLAGVRHSESLTGACIITATADGWELTLYQLGGQSKDPADTSAPRDDAQMVDAEMIDAAEMIETGARAGAADPESPFARLSAAMRDARLSAGRTLRDVASSMGISAGHLSQLETGKREPSLTLLLRFSTAVGIPMRTLLEGGADQPRAVLSSPAERGRTGTSYQPGVTVSKIGSTEARAGTSIFELIIDPVATGQDLPLEIGESSYLCFEAGGADVITEHEVLSAGEGDILKLGRQAGVRLRATGPGLHRILCVRQEA